MYATDIESSYQNLHFRNPVVAPKLLFHRLKTSLQRERAKYRPLIPSSLEDLAAAMEDFAPTRGMYRGIVTAQDGSSALLFASDEMLEVLRTATEIYIDGTFKVRHFLSFTQKFRFRLLCVVRDVLNHIFGYKWHARRQKLYRRFVYAQHCIKTTFV